MIDSDFVRGSENMGGCDEGMMLWGNETEFGICVGWRWVWNCTRLLLYAVILSPGFLQVGDL